MRKIDEIITADRLQRLREIREESRETVYREALPIVGKLAVDELREFYNMYDERLYIWLAGLWDPELGAFYYSNSARDTEGFLPDIESTVQATVRFGADGSYRFYSEDGPHKNMPAKMRADIVRFILSLQDPDGYFYHSQWGKEISPTRRGRDLGWARRFLTESGVEPAYLPPYKLDNSGNKSKSLPDYLQDIDAFRQKLSEFDLSTRSYHFGNWVDSQTSQIRAAGPEFVELLVYWLNTHQRTDNGLWEEQINYASVNGLMKISGAYPGLGATIPNAILGVDSAIKAALSDEPVNFVCEVYNPWIALRNTFKALPHDIASDERKKVREILWEHTPELIRKTREKLMICRCDDGTFSYFKNCSADRSQGAPVAVPNTKEGDVNASGIASNGTPNCMCVALGIPKVPVFTSADGELFFDLIENAQPIVKKCANPFGDKLPPSWK